MKTTSNRMASTESTNESTADGDTILSGKISAEISLNPGTTFKNRYLTKESGSSDATMYSFSKGNILSDEQIVDERGDDGETEFGVRRGSKKSEETQKSESNSLDLKGDSHNISMDEIIDEESRKRSNIEKAAIARNENALKIKLKKGKHKLHNASSETGKSAKKQINGTIYAMDWDQLSWADNATQDLSVDDDDNTVDNDKEELKEDTKKKNPKQKEHHAANKLNKNVKISDDHLNFEEILKETSLKGGNKDDLKQGIEAFKSRLEKLMRLYGTLKGKADSIGSQSLGDKLHDSSIKHNVETEPTLDDLKRLVRILQSYPMYYKTVNGRMSSHVDIDPSLNGNDFEVWIDPKQKTTTYDTTFDGMYNMFRKRSRIGRGNETKSKKDMKRSGTRHKNSTRALNKAHSKALHLKPVVRNKRKTIITNSTTQEELKEASNAVHQEIVRQSEESEKRLKTIINLLKRHHTSHVDKEGTDTKKSGLGYPDDYYQDAILYPTHHVNPVFSDNAFIRDNALPVINRENGFELQSNEMGVNGMSRGNIGMNRGNPGMNRDGFGMVGNEYRMNGNEELLREGEGGYMNADRRYPTDEALMRKNDFRNYLVHKYADYLKHERPIFKAEASIWDRIANDESREMKRIHRIFQTYQEQDAENQQRWGAQEGMKTGVPNNRGLYSIRNVAQPDPNLIAGEALYRSKVLRHSPQQYGTVVANPYQRDNIARLDTLAGKSYIEQSRMFDGYFNPDLQHSDFGRSQNNLPSLDDPRFHRVYIGDFADQGAYYKLSGPINDMANERDDNFQGPTTDSFHSQAESRFQVPNEGIYNGNEDSSVYSQPRFDDQPTSNHQLHQSDRQWDSYPDLMYGGERQTLEPVENRERLLPELFVRSLDTRMMPGAFAYNRPRGYLPRPHYYDRQQPVPSFQLSAKKTHIPRIKHNKVPRARKENQTTSMQQDDIWEEKQDHGNNKRNHAAGKHTVAKETNSSMVENTKPVNQNNSLDNEDSLLKKRSGIVFNYDSSPSSLGPRERMSDASLLKHQEILRVGNPMQDFRAKETYTQNVDSVSPRISMLEDIQLAGTADSRHDGEFIQVLPQKRLGGSNMLITGRRLSSTGVNTPMILHPSHYTDSHLPFPDNIRSGDIALLQSLKRDSIPTQEEGEQESENNYQSSAVQVPETFIHANEIKRSHMTPHKRKAVGRKSEKVHRNRRDMGMTHTGQGSPIKYSKSSFAADATAKRTYDVRGPVSMNVMKRNQTNMLEQIKNALGVKDKVKQGVGILKEQVLTARQKIAPSATGVLPGKAINDSVLISGGVKKSDVQQAIVDDIEKITQALEPSEEEVPNRSVNDLTIGTNEKRERVTKIREKENQSPRFPKEGDFHSRQMPDASVTSELSDLLGSRLFSRVLKVHSPSSTKGKDAGASYDIVKTHPVSDKTTRQSENAASTHQQRHEISKKSETPRPDPIDRQNSVHGDLQKRQQYFRLNSGDANERVINCRRFEIPNLQKLTEDVKGRTLRKVVSKIRNIRLTDEISHDIVQYIIHKLLRELNIPEIDESAHQDLDKSSNSFVYNTTFDFATAGHSEGSSADPIMPPEEKRGFIPYGSLSSHTDAAVKLPKLMPSISAYIKQESENHGLFANEAKSRSENGHDISKAAVYGDVEFEDALFEGSGVDIKSNKQEKSEKMFQVPQLSVPSASSKVNKQQIKPKKKKYSNHGKSTKRRKHSKHLHRKSEKKTSVKSTHVPTESKTIKSGYKETVQYQPKGNTRTVQNSTKVTNGNVTSTNRRSHVVPFPFHIHRIPIRKTIHDYLFPRHGALLKRLYDSPKLKYKMARLRDGIYPLVPRLDIKLPSKEGISLLSNIKGPSVFQSTDLMTGKVDEASSKRTRMERTKEKTGQRKDQIGSEKKEKIINGTKNIKNENVTADSNMMDKNMNKGQQDSKKETLSTFSHEKAREKSNTTNSLSYKGRLDREGEKGEHEKTIKVSLKTMSDAHRNRNFRKDQIPESVARTHTNEEESGGKNVNTSSSINQERISAAKKTYYPDKLSKEITEIEKEKSDLVMSLAEIPKSKKLKLSHAVSLAEPNKPSSHLEAPKEDSPVPKAPLKNGLGGVMIHFAVGNSSNENDGESHANENNERGGKNGVVQEEGANWDISEAQDKKGSQTTESERIGNEKLKQKTSPWKQQIEGKGGRFPSGKQLSGAKDTSAVTLGKSIEVIFKQGAFTNAHASKAHSSDNNNDGMQDKTEHGRHDKQKDDSSGNDSKETESSRVLSHHSNEGKKETESQKVYGDDSTTLADNNKQSKEDVQNTKLESEDQNENKDESNKVLEKVHNADSVTEDEAKGESDSTVESFVSDTLQQSGNNTAKVEGHKEGSINQDETRKPKQSSSDTGHGFHMKKLKLEETNNTKAENHYASKDNGDELKVKGDVTLEGYKDQGSNKTLVNLGSADSQNKSYTRNESLSDAIKTESEKVPEDSKHQDVVQNSDASIGADRLTQLNQKKLTTTLPHPGQATFDVSRNDKATDKSFNKGSFPDVESEKLIGVKEGSRKEGSGGQDASTFLSAKMESRNQASTKLSANQSDNAISNGIAVESSESDGEESGASKHEDSEDATLSPSGHRSDLSKGQDSGFKSASLKGQSAGLRSSLLENQDTGHRSPSSESVDIGSRTVASGGEESGHIKSTSTVFGVGSDRESQAVEATINEKEQATTVVNKGVERASLRDFQSNKNNVEDPFHHQRDGEMADQKITSFDVDHKSTSIDVDSVSTKNTSMAFLPKNDFIAKEDASNLEREADDNKDKVLYNESSDDRDTQPHNENEENERPTERSDQVADGSAVGTGSELQQNTKIGSDAVINDEDKMEGVASSNSSEPSGVVSPGTRSGLMNENLHYSKQNAAMNETDDSAGDDTKWGIRSHIIFIKNGRVISSPQASSKYVAESNKDTGDKRTVTIQGNATAPREVFVIGNNESAPILRDMKDSNQTSNLLGGFLIGPNNSSVADHKDATSLAGHLSTQESPLNKSTAVESIEKNLTAAAAKDLDDLFVMIEPTDDNQPSAKSRDRTSSSNQQTAVTPDTNSAPANSDGAVKVSDEHRQQYAEDSQGTPTNGNRLKTITDRIGQGETLHANHLTNSAPTEVLSEKNGLTNEPNRINKRSSETSRLSDNFENMELKSLPLFADDLPEVKDTTNANQIERLIYGAEDDELQFPRDVVMEEEKGDAEDDPPIA